MAPPGVKSQDATTLQAPYPKNYLGFMMFPFPNQIHFQLPTPPHKKNYFGWMRSWPAAWGFPALDVA